MSIILVIVALAVFLLILCAIKGKKTISPENYLKKLGYEFTLVDEKKIKIPNSFGENMQQYNELQKSQGFDLKKFSGKVCVQKRYLVDSESEENNKTNDETKKYVANLIVYENNVVGGDVQEQYYSKETGPKRLDSLKKAVNP